MHAQGDPWAVVFIHLELKVLTKLMDLAASPLCPKTGLRW